MNSFWLTRREISCALEVAEQYNHINLNVLQTYLEKNVIGPVKVYDAAHTICARLENNDDLFTSHYRDKKTVNT